MKSNLLVFAIAALGLVSILFTGCAPVNQINIISRESWRAEKAKEYKTQTINSITVHHEGTFFDTTKQDPKDFILKIQKYGMGKQKNWADVPYHYFIDMDGLVYQGRSDSVMGESTTVEDVSGQLQIALLGNFEQQEPTTRQLNTLINFLIQLCDKYNLKASKIKIHKELSNTQCPGKNLYKYFENGFINGEVAKYLRKY